ncbi:MAG TPA: GGDEF domain-containing protein [Myxococcales bacterium]|jgi:diguanylate cyclase (GGDEF)-like protein|nr:GGDEF domain-containing protein [Myxococcales bacterium]
MSPGSLSAADEERLREAMREAAQLGASLLTAAGVPELLRLAASAGAVLGGGAGVVLSCEPGDAILRVEEGEGLERKVASAFRFEASSGFANEVWERTLRGEDPLALRQALQGELGFRAPVLQPLGSPGALRGIWAADVRAVGPLAELLSASLRQFGVAVAAAFAAVEARGPGRSGMTDALTGLFDRRFAEGHLRRELARAKRYREPLSLVLIDMDAFDEVNERHGYACGDRVLKQIAKLLVGYPNASRELAGLALCFRETDVAARWGADSFLVLLPATPQAGAHHAAERFLAGLRTSRFTATAGGPQIASVTATAAVVTFPDDGTTAELLVEMAESLVASAAATGGDKVVVPAPSATPKRASR